MATVDAVALNNAINDFLNSADYDESKRSRYKNLNKMIDLQKCLNNTLRPNSFPICYTESSSGRLCPSYGTNFPNPINMSHELKALIYSGQGLYDYDISNAHYSIFNSLCKQNRLECPNIEHYLENKVELRNIWSEEYDVEVKLIKTYILS
jgi:hypothetical protein